MAPAAAHSGVVHHLMHLKQRGWCASAQHESGVPERQHCCPSALQVVETPQGRRIVAAHEG